MKTLDDAMSSVLRINGLVEQYALQVKRNQSGATFLSNIRRQLPLRNCDLILDVDCGDVLRRADLEGDSQVVGAVVRALRVHVEHVRNAVDLRFDPPVGQTVEPRPGVEDPRLRWRARVESLGDVL